MKRGHTAWSEAGIAGVARELPAVRGFGRQASNSLPFFDPVRPFVSLWCLAADAALLKSSGTLSVPTARDFSPRLDTFARTARPEIPGAPRGYVSADKYTSHSHLTQESRSPPGTDFAII